MEIEPPEDSTLWPIERLHGVLRMVALCGRLQVRSAIPLEPERDGVRRCLRVEDWIEGEVDIRYGSLSTDGQTITPNAGGPFFMKSIIERTEIRELDQVQARAHAWADD